MRASERVGQITIIEEYVSDVNCTQSASEFHLQNMGCICRPMSADLTAAGTCEKSAVSERGFAEQSS